MTTVQLTTSVGEVVRDPDRDALRGAVFRADRSGRGAFVVLDGDATGGAPFLQATRLPGGVWRAEIRRVAAGPPQDHYWTLLRDAAAVVDVFWSWVTGTPTWQRERWQPMTGLAAAG